MPRRRPGRPAAEDTTLDQYVAYLREQAAKYRELAQTIADPEGRRELLDLATTCDQVANNIEDRTAGG